MSTDGSRINMSIFDPLKDLIQPITPDTALNLYKEQISQAFISTINDLLIRNLSLINARSTIEYSEIITLFRYKTGLDSTFIPSNHTDIIKNLFEPKGWKIRFVQPNPGEPGSPHYLFKKV